MGRLFVSQSSEAEVCVSKSETSFIVEFAETSKKGLERA